MAAEAKRSFDHVVVHLPTTVADSVSWGHEFPVDRRPDWFATRPARPVGVFDSRIVTGAVTAAAVAGIVVAVWVSQHIAVDATLRTAALFVHLAFLPVGFGAVLVADYHLVLWVLGRSTLADAVRGAERVGVPIWIGLVGLVLSGMVLSPSLASGLTQLKVGAVIVLTINGIQAMALGRKMGSVGSGPLPTSLMLRGAATASISQLCWWIAVAIGFWNSRH